jgi:hypothetical protein
MTAANAYNITLTKSSVTVTIATNRDTENWTKALITITPPKTTQNQDINVGKNDTKVVDILNKAERRFTFDGTLSTGVGASDTSNDAEGKKTDLRKIFFAGGVVIISNYEAETSLTVGLEKCEVVRITNGLAAADGEAEFEVKITCIVGVDFA